MDNYEMRIILKYEFLLGNNAVTASKNIQKVYGDDALSIRTIQRWFEKFRSGQSSLEDEPRGRPGTVLDDKVLKDLIDGKPCQTSREIGRTLHVHHTTALRHLHSIGKVRKLEQWIPHDLTEKHMINRLEACLQHLKKNKIDPFLDRIVTCDEKWISYNNRKRSYQWLDKNDFPKAVPKPSIHQKKLLISVWWGVRGIIEYFYLPTGETMNAEVYCDYLEKMHAKLMKQWPALCNRHGPILLQDNARPHVSVKTIQKLSDMNYEVLHHPPYSPDLTPTDFYLFKHLAQFLQGKIFTNQEDLKNAVREFFDSKSQEFFKTGIYALPKRWQMCVDAEGAYFDN